VVLAQHVQHSSVRRIHEPDVVLLNNLPVSLKEELHFEVYVPTLSCHPFFLNIGVLEILALTRICHNAMKQQYLHATQDLFSYGKDGNHMYFVVGGEAVYYHGKRTATELSKMKEATDGATAIIKEEQWICEQVLVMKWENQGLLTAKMPCEFAVVDSAIFRSMVKRFPVVCELCKAYANLYVKRMLLDGQEPTDITMGYGVLTELVEEAKAGIEMPTGSTPLPSDEDVLMKVHSMKGHSMKLTNKVSSKRTNKWW